MINKRDIKITIIDTESLNVQTNVYLNQNKNKMEHNHSNKFYKLSIIIIPMNKNPRLKNKTFYLSACDVRI